MHEKYDSEPFDEQALLSMQQTKSKPERLVFGEKALEFEPSSDMGRLEADVQGSLAEKRKQVLVRLQAAFVTPPPNKPKASLLSLFLRSKKLTMPPLIHPDTPSSVATTVFTSRGNSLETASSPNSLKFSDLFEKPTLIAVPYPSQNSDRRVAVRCQSSTIILSVSTETNAENILLMASTMFRHHVNPASSVVAESYHMLGLERRLRRYERIHDIMNSWDNDHEDFLLILSCPASMSDHDLDIDAISNSSEAPSGFTLELDQSSRPGKWNKRWITLLENGQMYSAKTEDALPGDTGCVQLCHLADFDIYSPKEAEIRQSVKPPKQFCYAIKSQQKSMLFPDEVNFVHFFSTDNEEIATQFYEMVHRWRSWLLVAKNFALDRTINAPAPKITFVSINGSGTSANETKSESNSSAASFLRIDTFTPLLDVNNVSKLAEEARKLQSTEPPRSATADKKQEARPLPPDFRRPPTPVTKATDQPGKPSLRAELDKYPGSPPNPMHHYSPVPPRMEPWRSPAQANRTPLEFAALSVNVPEEKSDPRPWFPSAAEHTAKMRKDEPPPLRRPATADPALHGRDRRGYSQFSINANFTEPPRPFGNLGSQPPKSGSNTPPIYKWPGTPMLPAVPRAQPMLSPKRGNVDPAPPPMSPRSRSTAARPQSRRHMPENMPPVPPLPNGSMRRDPPTLPAVHVPVSVQPRHMAPQRGPALQPIYARHM